MKLLRRSSSFKKDNRGVSELIGIIVLFGFLIVALAGYQAQVVPQQNAEIEFQHFQEIQNDLVEVRSAISTAGQSGVAQYPTVTLGTNYPTRLFTINPPPPSGTLQTSAVYNISISNQSGSGPKNVSTQFLEYKNGYNELDIGSIWYENSVLYLDERNAGGGIVPYEDQNIINGNESARVTALQNDFRASSNGRVTLDLEPTENATINSSELEGNVTIKIPSRLNDTTYWDEAIDTTGSNGLWYHGTEPYPGESDIYWVNITVDADKLKINTVGIQGEPNSQNTIKQGIGVQDSDRGESSPADTELPGTLTAEVTQEGSSGNNPGGDDWLVTVTYDGPEGVTITAVSDDTTYNGNIGAGENSDTLNLGRGNSNKVYPISITGENNSGQECSATLNEGDGQVNVCG